ncbi:MAG: EamA family transporter [Pseudomonadota bacterium]|nr:EamA family transporter [Pseudomonadota bacterium]
MSLSCHPGVLSALSAALLFGVGTPISKLLLGPVNPWLLAGLLYLGSGLGLALWRLLKNADPVHLDNSETKWLAGAILAGGMIAPVLLMWGLSRISASSAALLLNAEGVLTALLAWFVFRENFDRRVAIGMTLIVVGTIVLTWSNDVSFDSALPALAIMGACLGWAIDNNLTRKVALADATFIAMIKGLAAGTANVAIAWLLGATMPRAPVLMAAGTVGFLSYGLSLVLFVVALRHLGTARTGAYFSTAPFIGAFLAIPLLGEPLSIQFMVAAVFMACGVWLHLTEQHDHLHTHEGLKHEHEHTHDNHHQHAHIKVMTGSHTHQHSHEPVTHSHSHYPDAHHRHDHE